MRPVAGVGSVSAFPRDPGGWRLRRGSSVLASVLLGMAIILGLIFVFQGRTSAVSREAAGALAAENARATASWMLEECQAQLDEILSTPRHPAYKKARQAILQGMHEKRSVDLVPFFQLDPTTSVLSWKRSRKPAVESVGQIKTEVKCFVEGWTALVIPGPVAPDEMVARLVITAESRDELAGIGRSCQLSSVHEFRVQPVAVPRPFSDACLYLPRVTLVTDPVRANVAREKILRLRDEIREAVASMSPPAGGDELAAWEAIKAGVQGSVDDRVPRLPEGPSAMAGPFHVESIDLKSLDLAGGLESDLAALESVVRVLRAGPITKERLEDSRQLVIALNRGFYRIWGFHRTFGLLPLGGPEHSTRIAPFEEALGHRAQDERAMVGLAPTDPMFVQWKAGSRILPGFVRLEDAAPVELQGTLPGRTVLTVSAPALRLGPIQPSGPGDHLVFVVSGGEVTLTGTVHASLVLCGSSRLLMKPGAVLEGGLYVHGEGVRLPAQGTLRPTTVGAAPRDFTDGTQARGVYGMAFSPEPLRFDRSRGATRGR